MPIKLRALGKDQIPEAVRLSITTNAANPFRKIILPNGISEASYDKLRRDLVDSANDRDSHLLQLYDTEAGKMVAFAVWCWTQPVSEKEWTEKSQKRLEAHPKARQDILRPFLRTEGEAKKKVMGQQRWWELVTLSVDLEYQRKGLGGRLMEWGIGELERKKLQSVIVSTQAGYGLYVKWGYEPQEVWQEDLSKWGGEGTYLNAIMTRYPKDIGGMNLIK